MMLRTWAHGSQGAAVAAAVAQSACPGYRRVRGKPRRATPHHVTPRTFFRGSLALPLLIPALGWWLFPNMGTAILVLSLVMAGLPYLLFACFLSWKLGRVAQTGDVPRPILLAPLWFLSFELVAVLAWSAHLEGVGLNLLGTLLGFLPIAMFLVMFGYFYVGAAILMFVWFRRRGWIRLDEAGNAPG